MKIEQRYLKLATSSNGSPSSRTTWRCSPGMCACITLVLEVLMRMPSAAGLVSPCSCSSKAKYRRRKQGQRNGRSYQPEPLSNLARIQSIMCLKWAGESAHPCRTPERISKGNEPPTLALTVICFDEPQQQRLFTKESPCPRSRIQRRNPQST